MATKQADHINSPLYSHASDRTSCDALRDTPRLWQIKEKRTVNRDLPDAWDRASERGAPLVKQQPGRLSAGLRGHSNRSGSAVSGTGAHLLARSSVAEREGGEQCTSRVFQAPRCVPIPIRSHPLGAQTQDRRSLRPPCTVPPIRRDLKFRGDGDGAAKFAGQSRYLGSASVPPPAEEPRSAVMLQRYAECPRMSTTPSRKRGRASRRWRG